MRSVPEEMLLQVVSCVAAHGDARGSLCAMCSTFRSLGRIASDALYRDVRLEPEDAPLFLRTLFEQPELAATVERLQVSVLLGFNTALDPDLKAKSIRKLHQLRLANSLWRQKISDDALPTTAGLILALLPQLTELDLSIGPTEPDDVSQSPWIPLFGSLEIPTPISSVFGQLRSLTIGGNILPLLQCDFPKLRTLHVRKVTIPMLYCLRPTTPGGEGVENLHLEVTVDVANLDRGNPWNGRIDNLITAMNWNRVTRLRIDLWHPDTLNDSNKFSAQHLIDQLKDIAPVLRELTINCVGDDKHQQSRDGFRQRPITSIQRFASLTTMTLPSHFLDISSVSQNSNQPQPVTVARIRLRTAPGIEISKCESMICEQHITKLHFAPRDL